MGCGDDAGRQISLAFQGREAFRDLMNFRVLSFFLHKSSFLKPDWWHRAVVYCSMLDTAFPEVTRQSFHVVQRPLLAVLVFGLSRQSFRTAQVIPTFASLPGVSIQLTVRLTRLVAPATVGWSDVSVVTVTMVVPWLAVNEVRPNCIIPCCGVIADVADVLQYLLPWR